MAAALLLAGLAGIAIWLCKRLKLPTILAWLLVGVVAGPQGVAWLTSQQIHLVAELGIVFLMFSLGLEFSLPRLWAMRSRVFGLGSLQVLVSGGVAAAVALFAGLAPRAAVVVGAAIALSSTAIVLKQLDELGWLNRRHGELSVSILLFQDLAVIPLLIIIPMLGSETQGSALLLELTWAVLKGGMVFAALLWAGGYLLPKVFDHVASVRSEELFVLVTLVVALATGYFTLSMGLSMALGAFLAGMLLGESQYRQQLEADIRPFRDLLMGVFFVSVGMLLNFSTLQSDGLLILLLLPLLLISKAAVIAALAKLTGEKSKDALATGIGLAQIGEFSFILVGMALTWQVISPDIGNLLVVLGVLSMCLSPALVTRSIDVAKWVLAGKLRWRPRHHSATMNLASAAPILANNHVLLLGYGRVGQTLARFLRQDKLPYVALDLDPIRVREAKAAKQPVLFGDARRVDILRAAGIERARLVVITFDQRRSVFNLLDLIKQLAPKLAIIVRTRDDSTLTALEQAGADQVIPESLEGSLMVVSQVLYRLGVPAANITQRLEVVRHRHYRPLAGFSFASSSRYSDTLHRVILPETAWAIGQPIAALKLPHVSQSIEAIIRQTQLLECTPELHLCAADQLLLLGDAATMDAATHYLLYGQ